MNGLKHGCRLVLLVCASCGPGDDKSTETSPTETSPTGTSPTETSPTETSATATSGGAAGCVASDAQSCAAASPIGPEGFCLWLEAQAVEVVGTICTTTPAPGRCIEAEVLDGGGHCDGQFKAQTDSVELYLPPACEELSGWAACFPSFDFEMPADPACVCIAPQYCAGQADEASCTAASNALRTCTWQGGACQ